MNSTIPVLLMRLSMQTTRLAQPAFTQHIVPGATLRAHMNHVAGEEAPAFKPTVEALAQTMRNQFPDCTEASLQAEGFTLAFQREHGDAARALANKTFTRDVSSADERAYRIERAANLAAGLVAHDAIASYLLANGYKPRELGDIIGEVIVRMCEIVVGSTSEPSQVQ